MADMCSTCVFRPGNLMQLKPGRLRQMVRDSVAVDGVITCHKTLFDQAEQEGVCRGFYDRHSLDVAGLRLARVMGLAEEVPAP